MDDVPAWAEPQSGGATRHNGNTAAFPPEGKRCTTAAWAFHIWTLAVGLALVADAVIRAVYAFGSADNGRPPDAAGRCTLGGLHRCVDAGLIATAELCLALSEFIAACWLIAAETRQGCCVRCVVQYCGMLATFGGKGVFLLAVGAVVALSGQGFYIGPDGLSLAHVVIGCCAFCTGVVLVMLDCLCLTMPSHPTRDHYHQVRALVRANEPEAGRRAVSGAEVPPHDVPTVTGTILSPVASASAALYDIRVEGDGAFAAARPSRAPMSKPNNIFYGNRHLNGSELGGSTSEC